MSASINKTDDRLFSLDVLKAISITAVVSYHSIFVPVSTYVSASYLIDVIFSPLRFCVPVLFTISFLLLERSLVNHCAMPKFQLIKKRIIRLLIPTVFWVSIAILIKFNTNSFKLLLVSIIQGTIFPGAYYLLAMLQLLLVFPWINKWFNCFKLISIAILLDCLFFLIINIFLSTDVFPLVIFFLRNIGRSLFIYWLSYIALGVFFYKNWLTVVKISESIPKKLKILMLCVTSLIMVAEASWLRSITGDSFEPFEYVMFSCVLSVIVMFLCFASITEVQLSPPFNKAVKFLSKYTLGIFYTNGIISFTISALASHFYTNLTFNLVEVLLMKLFGFIFLLLISVYLASMLDTFGLKACVR